MTDAEIIGLLTKMLLEDLRQPAITQEEFPSLLEEVLRAYEYERRWQGHRPTSTPIGPTQWQEEAEIYAAASSAAQFVNRPDELPAWSGDAWPAEEARSLRGL